MEGVLGMDEERRREGLGRVRVRTFDRTLVPFGFYRPKLFRDGNRTTATAALYTAVVPALPERAPSPSGSSLA